MQKLLAAFCIFFGLLLPSCLAGEAVTLAAFLETIPAQNNQMTEILNASFEGSKGEPNTALREVIGNVTISEICFHAFKKGDVGRDPYFLVFLEVATTAYDKNGLPNLGSEYPASFDRKLVGFRVAAFPSRDETKVKE